MFGHTAFDRFRIEALHFAEDFRWCISNLFSFPLAELEPSPGERSTIGEQLRSLIRKTSVPPGGHGLPPHDMPMARYHTSRMRRSRMSSIGSGRRSPPHN